MSILRYYPAIAVVRSGLSKTSYGDGRNSKTVVHAELADEFEAGTLRRRAGQLLCRRSQAHLWLAPETAAVNCPTCLKAKPATTFLTITTHKLENAGYYTDVICELRRAVNVLL